jgi:hypothetical protein
MARNLTLGWTLCNGASHLRVGWDSKPERRPHQRGRVFILAGNSGQRAAAFLASRANLASWSLQLAESKGGDRVRIPLSPPKLVL